MRKHGCLLILGVLLTFLLPGGRAMASTDTCTTGQCHAKIVRVTNVHSPLQSCDNCHTAIKTPHPQGGVKTFKLVQGLPDLCYRCHPPFGKKRFVHSTVKEGMCMSCHNPHGSNEPKLLLGKARDLCAPCHKDKLDFEYMHGPASMGDCTVCHNPHESDNKGLSIEGGADLCLVCHLDMKSELKKKVVHPPVVDGCSSCHNPHGSSHRMLLNAEGEKLCFACHNEIADKIAQSKTVHSPIRSEKGCASCHAPHAENGENLLPKTGKTLCLDCHPNVIKQSMKVLHGPIQDGSCTPCHDPHGSPYAALLVKEFPGDIYVPYSEEKFSLCFSCHKSDAFRYPDTSFSTGFRDGERNLHFLHVNIKNKGRNCNLCHAMHGGTLPKLLGESVPFGKWNLPLNFVKTDTGGSCTPGCHRDYAYDRQKPAKKPEPMKPAEKKKK